MQRILLVEDDPYIVEALTELLVGADYTVDTADTQDEAIALVNRSIASRTYQLVLLDVTLRQGNGFAVCAAISRLRPSCPSSS